MEQEVIVEEVVPDNDGIEPSDWEDHLYEAWLEERRGREKRKTAEAGV
jgi:hypothetical protein